MGYFLPLGVRRGSVQRRAGRFLLLLLFRHLVHQLLDAELRFLVDVRSISALIIPITLLGIQFVALPHQSAFLLLLGQFQVHELL